jgi:tRNA threonylcarbamoyladenosine biosynthesis protein TsaE
MQTEFCPDEAATRRFAAEFGRRLKAGRVVLLEGPLGAGKTTFVKGVLEALGFQGFVRSPTFNLLQTFQTDPPVLHADLYRLTSAQSLGLEEYFDSHLCLIEWPDRLGTVLDKEKCWRVEIDFEGEGRLIRIDEPSP